MEDEPRLARATSRLLERVGYRVVHADSGQAALDLVRQGGIDVVLLDLGLPDFPGAEVLDRLQEERPDLPVIVSSGSHAFDAAAHGPVGVLPKPFTRDQLVQAIEQALKGG